MNYKKHEKIRVTFFLGLALSWFLHIQNNAIVVTNIDYKNTKIPVAFEGYKIVQISDLHNKQYGTKLLTKIKAIKPNSIVITGDLIDRRFTNVDVAMEFIDGITKIAPVYYVSGNHEAWSKYNDELQARLVESGVIVLNNKKMELHHKNQSIELIGVQDPAYLTQTNKQKSNTSSIRSSLRKLTNKDSFQILLSHRPELFKMYQKYNIDLVFSGHAHGGQIRLPLLGALVAPNQGILPKYTSGAYREKESTLVVSRGLGNSLFPYRLFNQPEVVVVTLHNK